MADDGDFHGHNTLLTTVIRGPCFFCLHKNWVTESPSGFTLLTPKLFDGVLLGKGNVKKSGKIMIRYGSMTMIGYTWRITPASDYMM